MIGFMVHESGAQDTPLASATGGGQRGHAVRPRGGVVCAGAPFHEHRATGDLSGRDGVGLHLVVTADGEERRAGAVVDTMRYKTARRVGVEGDVADAQVFLARRGDGEKVAVAHEGRHACPACGEPDAVAFGQEAAGKSAKERRSEI